MVNVRTALKNGIAQLREANVPSFTLAAELLLLHVLSRNRTWLYAHPEEILTDGEEQRYFELITRRAAGEPTQHLTGKQEFWDLEFEVSHDVLIPRPETEHLVEALLNRIRHDAPLRIADIGTGSGAIAAALANALPHAIITALDNSAPALAIAQQNAARHNLASRIRFLESDLLSAVEGEIFDAIVSNPPYVPEEEVLEEQVRNFEPHTALYAGPSGLEIYRRLIPQALTALNPQGWLLMEIGHGQRDDLAQLLSQWNDVIFVEDLQGIPRVAIARRP